MFALPVIAALAVAQPTSSAPSPLPAEQVVEHVAEAIEERYFDPAAAARIAGELRQDVRAGRYRGLEGGRLATALTQRLEPFDAHFSVSYRPQAEPRAAAPAQPGYGYEEQSRRSGYGFRQVATLPGNIGYIDLRSFAPIDFDDPNWQPRRSADGALALVARNDALIIDLRNNGGGAPSMVGYLVSAFVEPGRDVYNVFHARDRRQSEAPGAPYAGPRLTMPVYILTSARTGSAAEAFAYTLQAAGRAQVIGEPSAGAANPGGEVPLPGGYRVFVSSASPRNPITGGNWERTGVRPDIAVPQSDALARAQILALEAALPNIPPVERPDAEWTLAALGAQQSGLSAPDPSAYAGSFGELTVVAEDGISIRSGQRPQVRLVWLEDDQFASAENPGVRYRFRRGAGGRIEAIEVRRIDGTAAEHVRTN